MIYAAARPRLQTGDLLAWSTSSHGSWWTNLQTNAVRRFTMSEYAHVGLAWAEHGRVFVLEAVTTGVRIFPLSLALPCYWIARPRPLSEAALAFALSQAGKRYESKWRMALLALTGRPMPADDRWQCAEYTLAALAADQERLPVPGNQTPSKTVAAALAAWGPLELLVEG